MEKDAIGRPRKKMAREKSRMNNYLKKTRIFELIDPTPERWDIYES